MGKAKEHDWFVETLGNPNFTNTDFKNAGININNTSIASEEIYASSPQIQQLPQFQTNGQFDQAKLHQHYEQSIKSYNNLAKNTYENDLITDERIFHRDDIFVSPEYRRQGFDTQLTTTPNPDQTTFGITRLNREGKRTKTPMELAESNRIFDPATGKFTDDTPENSFFKNFFKPIVMATWDFDADKNGNPTSDPTQIMYHKGEYKLDENGNYYTEFLNGRDNYGKQVISKFNLLTPEDSKLNKLDFFDSDDINKSTTGSIIRNAVEILPLFIPYVGEAYLYSSLAMNTTQALSTLGKLFVGSDNKTLNNTEAFFQSFDKSISENAQQHTFSAENVLNMVGETFTFLKGQRMIAEEIPGWFKGKIPKNKAEFNTKAKEIADDYFNKNFTKVLNQGFKSKQEVQTAMNELRDMATLRAQSSLNDMIKAYQELGQQISRNYMAITFGLHTYGTAKSQGVSDEVATMLTLGAIGGQYALLNSHINKWVFPESKLESQQLKKLVDVLGNGSIKETVQKAESEIAEATTKAEKFNIFQKIFNKGKELSSKVYESPTPTASRAIVTGAIGSGVEMTAFQVLDDVIASVYNVGSWLSGNDNRMSAWDNVLERYANSFLGGAFAGILSAPDLIKASKGIYNMDSEKAMNYLVNMVSEGKQQKFLQEVDKHDFGNTYLSAREKLTLSDQSETWAQGDAVDNQSVATRRMLHETVRFIEQILKDNNALLSSKSLLDVKLRNDFKLSMLQNSTTVRKYLQDFLSNNVKIVKLVNQIRSLETDKKQRQTEKEANNEVKSEGVKELTTLQKELAEVLKTKDEFISGKKAPEYFKRAIFEMSYGINSAFVDAFFIPYAEKQYNKEFNQLNSNEISEAYKKYQNFIEVNKGDVIEKAFTLFEQSNNIASDFLREFDFNKLNGNDSELLKIFSNVANIYSSLNQQGESLLALSKDLYTNLTNQKLFNIFEKYADETQKTIFSELANLTTNADNLLLKDNYGRHTAALILTIAPKFLNELEQELNRVGYVDSQTKTEIKNTLTALKGYISDLSNNPLQIALNFVDEGITREDVPLFDEKLETLTIEAERNLDDLFLEELYGQVISVEKELNGLTDQNLVDTIQKYVYKLTKGEFNFKELVSSLDTQLQKTQSSPDKFFVDSSIANNISTALKILDMFRNNVIAANNVVDKPNNILGYNPTVNNLIPESNLFTIEPENTGKLLQSISNLRDKLQFYQNLIWAASANKLREQVKIDTNTRFELYKQLSSKFDFLPSNWEGVEEFKQQLKDLNNLKLFSEAGSTELTSDELNSLQKDTIKFEQAIYDFFKKNENKINDPKQLAEFLKQFNLKDDKLTTLGSTDKFNDDPSLIWYLASRSALNPSEFYSNYAKILDGQIAPTYTQMLGIYLFQASVFNKPHIQKFINAYREALSQNSAGDELELLNVTSYYPAFNNIVLLEAGPGAGKTASIIPQSIRFIENSKDDLLKNIWIASTSKKDSPDISDAAKSLRERCRLDKEKDALSKKILMQRISNEWHESLTVDDKLEINPDDITINEETGVVEYNFKLNEILTEQIPKIIVIDEISDYSELDLRLIDKFASKYGISVIVSGDFEQSGLYGNIDWKFKSHNRSDYKLELLSTQFVRIPKLDISFRTENSQQDYNLALNKTLLPIFKNPTESLDSLGAKSIYYHWFKDSDGLYGTLVKNRQYTKYENIIQEIEFLISTLPEGEKIGYVYDSKDSEFYKYAQEHPDKFEFLFGNTAKGLEARYYILDITKQLSLKDNNTQAIRDFYTVMTRSKQGNLVLLPNDFTQNPNISISSNSKPDSSTTKVELNQNIIESISNQTKVTLNEAFPETKSVTYVDSKKEEIKEKIKTEPPKIETETHETITTDMKTEVEEVAQASNLNKTEVPTFEVTQSSKKQYVKFLGVDGSEDKGSTTVSEKFNYGLYTAFNNYTGLTRDYKIAINSSKRIDNYYGLQKIIQLYDGALELFNLDGSNNHLVQQRTQKILQRIRDLILTETDRNTLQNKIIDILRDNLFKVDKRSKFIEAMKSSYIRFGYESNYNQKDRIRDDIFARDHNSEKLYGLQGGDSKSDEISEKGLVFILGTNIDGKDQNLLTIPFAKLPNFLTILETHKENVNIKPLYEEYKRLTSSIPESDKVALYEAKKKFYNRLVELRENGAIGAGTLALLTRIYLHNSSDIVYLDGGSFGFKEDWTPAQTFKTTGPFVLSNLRGFNYETDGYTSDNSIDLVDVSDLANSNLFFTSRIKILNKSLLDSSGNEIIKAGDGFVLVGDSNFDNEGELISYYKEQLKNPNIPIRVKRFYVRRPRATVEEFITKVQGKYDKEHVIDRQIGNELTAYRIVEALDKEFGDTFWNEVSSLPQLEKGLGPRIRDLINECKGKSTSEILDKIKSLAIVRKERELDYRTQLEKFLYLYIFPNFAPVSRMIHSEEAQKKIITNIKQALKDNGIPYNLFWGKETRPDILDAGNGEAEMFNVVTDVNISGEYTYDLYGKPFQINRITTPVIVGDIFPLLRIIGNVLSSRKDSTGKTFYGSVHTLSYKNEGSRIQVEPSKSNIILGKEVKGINTSNKTKAIQEANQKGYVALDIDGILYIFGDKIDDQSIESQEKLDDGTIRVIVKNGDIYEGKLNKSEDNPKIEFLKVISSEKLKPADDVILGEDFNILSEYVNDILSDPIDQFSLTDVLGKSEANLSELLKILEDNDLSIDDLLESGEPEVQEILKKVKNFKDADNIETISERSCSLIINL